VEISATKWITALYNGLEAGATEPLARELRYFEDERSRIDTVNKALVAQIREMLKEATSGEEADYLDRELAQLQLYSANGASKEATLAQRIRELAAADYSSSGDEGAETLQRTMGQQLTDSSVNATRRRCGTDSSQLHPYGNVPWKGSALHASSTAYMRYTYDDVYLYPHLHNDVAELYRVNSRAVHEP
jgi:hypothetical protein